MTKKRFKFIRDSVARNLKTPICDNDGQSLTLGEVLDKMNELSKENEQLKQQLNRNIEVKEFLLEEELKLNDTARTFIMEHNKERYK